MDSGATDNFIHPNFVAQMSIRPKQLEKPCKIWNADSSKNKEGMITHYLDLEIETKGIQKDMHFYITNIGKEDIFLGYPWLAAYEPRFGEEALPVIIRSINPTIPRLRPTIAQSTLEGLKLRILHQLSIGGAEYSPHHIHRSRHSSGTIYDKSGNSSSVSKIR